MVFAVLKLAGVGFVVRASLSAGAVFFVEHEVAFVFLAILVD